MHLFSSDNLEVQRYATGAMRNLIYENADNKTALIDAGGLMPLVNILSEHDEELQKTITGRNGFLCQTSFSSLLLHYSVIQTGE